jgi:hypothetical protein
LSSDSAGRRCCVITRSAHASRSGRALIHWGLTLALFIAPAACTPWKHVTSIAVTPKATTSCFGAAISFDAVVRARGKTWSTDGPRTVPRGAFLFVGPDGEPMATLVFPDDSRAVAGPLAYQVVPRQRPVRRPYRHAPVRLRLPGRITRVRRQEARPWGRDLGCARRSGSRRGARRGWRVGGGERAHLRVVPRNRVRRTDHATPPR